MKTRLAVLALALAGASFTTFGFTAAAQTSTWKIDPAHSEVDFSIKHMGISNVHGKFGGITGSGGVTGTVTLDEKDISKSTVNATIDATTVDTGVAQRDAHLKSPDFFDVTKFPTATFVSKGFAKKDGKLTVTGDLTLHGVTKSVTLDVDGPSKDQPGMRGEIHKGFSATTTITRQDFGLSWGGNLKSGDPMLGSDVKIEINADIVKQ
jgi:polyisoprenoid-binding protein YceI